MSKKVWQGVGGDWIHFESVATHLFSKEEISSQSSAQYKQFPAVLLLIHFIASTPLA